MIKSLGSILLPLFAIAAAASAGTERASGKEMKETVAQATPCPEWYGDTEWNVSVWGTYAWAGTNGIADLSSINRAGTEFNLSLLFSNDRYLETDHAWGGGVDLKYFFHRYFGVGVQGFLLDAKRNTLDIEVPQPLVMSFTRGEENRVVGSALGTLTLRFPIHCSRLSPYVWAGGGGIFNGGERDVLIIDNTRPTLSARTEQRGAQTEMMGQFGGGLEFRFTRHLGWLNDFSWNVVDGPNNNFGMVRSGLTFSF